MAREHADSSENDSEQARRGYKTRAGGGSSPATAGATERSGRRIPEVRCWIHYALSKAGSLGQGDGDSALDPVQHGVGNESGSRAGLRYNSSL